MRNCGLGSRGIFFGIDADVPWPACVWTTVTLDCQGRHVTGQDCLAAAGRQLVAVKCIWRQSDG